MKWQKKHTVDIEMVHKLNSDGYSLVEISSMVNVPRGTLAVYLKKAGYPVYFNRHRQRLTRWQKRHKRAEFKCVNAWKRAMLEKYGHKCMICGYDKIVEAHHILPQIEGGKSTIENGALLCPNHHAEAHAGMINLVALLKSGELLGKQETAYQQPSRICSHETRDAKGSETREESKDASPRAPDSLTAEDIVRTMDINIKP